jgi:hypothetical protein
VGAERSFIRRFLREIPARRSVGKWEAALHSSDLQLSYYLNRGEGGKVFYTDVAKDRQMAAFARSRPMIELFT